MADQRSSVLHIGWWRNGFHPYDGMPTDRQIRKRGALVAAAIAAAWLTVAAALALTQPGGVPVVLVYLGPVVPTTALAGWTLGPRTFAATRTRGLIGAMAAIVVLLQAAAIAIVMSLGGAVEYNNPGYVAYAVFYFLVGIVLFGLPALAIAIPSALIWAKVLRRGRRGGGRGSGDRLR